MATNLKKLLAGLIAPTQTLEYTFRDLYTLRLLINCTAAQLDEYGEIVGQFRPHGIGDTAYRKMIYARIQLNRSNGEGDAVIKAVKQLTGGAVVLVEQFPAGMRVSSTGVIPEGARDIVDNIALGGVSLYLTGTPEKPLVWKEENGIVGNVGFGLSERGYSPTSGGQISERYA